jgi:hypothetical protein
MRKIFNIISLNSIHWTNLFRFDYDLIVIQKTNILMSTLDYFWQTREMNSELIKVEFIEECNNI